MSHSPAAPRSWTSTSALVLSLALVLLLPLARGAVDLPVEAVALGAATLAVLLATWKYPHVPPVALVFAVVVAFVAAQLIPVPPAVHAISPSAREAFRFSLAPLGKYPSARPLTLDVPETAHHLAKAVACLCLFVVGWTYSSTSRRKRLVLLALASSGVIVSCAVVCGALLGLQPLLAPAFPFVDANHLAGFLNLTSFVALGFALRTHGQGKIAWACAFILAVLGVFVSLSRGGIGAFFFGVAVFATRFMARRSPHARRLALVATVLVALAVVAFVAVGPVLAEMRTLEKADPDLKVHLWPSGLRVVSDYPLVGIGRGAFSTVFPAYRVERASVTFDYLENEWLQALIDLGIPVGTLLLGCLAYVWITAARRHDLSSPEVGVLAGTAALGVHLLFDFSVELLGVAVPLAISLGLLVRSTRPVPVSRWLLRSTICLAALVGGAGLWWFHAHAEDGSRELADAPLQRVPSLAATAVERRPGDYLPQVVAGARLAAAGDCSSAMPWLLRAMTLNPGFPDPHVYAARCLADHGAPLPARREYRLAIGLGSPGALAEAAQRWHSLDDLLDVIPDTPADLLALGDLLAAERPGDAQVVYARALTDFMDSRAILPLARASLATGDKERALTLARRRESENPSDEEAYRLAALVLIEMGQDAAALAELERGLAIVPGSPAISALLNDRLLMAHRFIEAKRVADGIATHSEFDVALRETGAARALAGMGRLGEAAERARSAAAALPDRPEPLIVLARLYADAGRFDEAIAAVEQARGLIASDQKDYSALLSELRHRADSAARDPSQMQFRDEEAVGSPAP